MNKFVVVHVDQSKLVKVVFHKWDGDTCNEHWFENITDSSWLRLQKLCNTHHSTVTCYPDQGITTGYILEIGGIK